MVVSPATVNLIVSIVMFFMASVISVTLWGVVQARIAYRMGEDTPKLMGYGSFNPFAHLTEYNIILFFVFGFFFNLWIMLGQWQFIDVRKISYPYRMLKLALIYASSILTSVVLAVFSLFVTVVLLGPVSFPVAHGVFAQGLLPFYAFSQVFAEYSTPLILLTLFFVALFFVNVICGMLNFVLYGVRWFISFLGWDRDMGRFWLVFWVSMLVPFVLLWLFDDALLKAVLYLVDRTVLGLMHVTGLDTFDAAAVAQFTKFTQS